MRTVAVILTLVACAAAEEELTPACAEIMTACHEADEATTDAGIDACHDVAHENVEADCAAEADACVAACEAVE